jgi:hypothetical protein
MSTLRRSLLTILIAGAIAGTLDITYACAFNYLRSGVKPIQVLQSVASGALGREAAISGGAKTAALGLFFHFLIALIWATVFYLASRVIPFMTKHAVISGIFYGLCVYLVMYGLVLRFSAIHSTRLPGPIPGSFCSAIWAYTCLASASRLRLSRASFQSK